MKKFEFIVDWMEAKNPYSVPFTSESSAKLKAIGMSQMWNIAEIHKWDPDTDKKKEPTAYLQKWSYSKGKLIGLFDPPKEGQAVHAVENKIKSAEASAAAAGVIKKEEEAKPVDNLDLPPGLDRKKNGIKPAPVADRKPKPGSAFNPPAPKPIEPETKSTETKETTMTDVNTETTAAAKKARKAPAKKAPAKVAAKKAPAAAKKAPAKAAKAAKAPKAAKAAKVPKAPKKEAKPYTGAHPNIWTAVGQKPDSKIGRIFTLLLKNEGNQVKMEKVIAAAYGDDMDAAGGINMRINQLMADVAASSVSKKVEFKKERRTADKDGTLGVYIK